MAFEQFPALRWGGAGTGPWFSRRSFLQVGSLGFGRWGLGGLGLGGAGLAELTLPSLLRAEAKSGRRQANKSVIQIFLSGGPPHQDMVDLKPEAPVEVRGEFRPIDTAVPGLHLCELLPGLARRAEQLAVIR
ncbi:MAG: DUF1501 domain-containing protein, partial [Planctomycetaceae bacterium]